MTDLDERIRRSIAPATSPSQFALLAVLELHDHLYTIHGGELCPECTDEMVAPYPCTTVRVIASSLGVPFDA